MGCYFQNFFTGSILGLFCLQNDFNLFVSLNILVFHINFIHSNRLVTGSYDNTIHIWRPTVKDVDKKATKVLSDDKEAHLLKVPDAHKAPVTVVAWVPKRKNTFVR